MTVLLHDEMSTGIHIDLIIDLMELGFEQDAAEVLLQEYSIEEIENAVQAARLKINHVKCLAGAIYQELRRRK